MKKMWLFAVLAFTLLAPLKPTTHNALPVPWPKCPGPYCI